MRLSVAIAALALLACEGTRGPVFVARQRADAGATSTALIQFGGTIPTGPAGLRAFAQAVQNAPATPFDGVVFDIGAPSLFSGSPVARTDFAPSLAELDAAPFGTLTETFQRVSVGAADVFDDQLFATAAANASVLAGVLAEKRVRGLMLDVQAYGARVWAMPTNPQGRSFADHRNKVQQRGRELGAALMDGHPTITILLTLGFSEPLRATCIAGEALAESRYALLPAFIDGLLQARDQRGGRARVIDAFLPAYATTDDRSFRVYRDLIHFRWDNVVSHAFPGLVTYTFPESGDAWAGAYHWPDDVRLHCRDDDRAQVARDLPASFGLMLDYEHDKRGGFRTAPEDFALNHHTPQSFERVVAAAVAASDGYVWIWTSSLDFWSVPGGKPAVPAEYVQALARGKRGTMP